MKKKKETIDLTKGSVAKGIVAFTIPLIFGQLLQQLYNMADAWVVGNFADNTAFAAVSTSGSLVFLVVGMFNGIAIGGGVVISRYVGAEDEKNIERSIHTNILFGIIASVLMTAIGLIFAPQILNMMDVPENVLPQSLTYFKIYFAGSATIIMYNIFMSIMRALGDSVRPMYYLAICSAVNVVLDLVFVGVFHWGASGAAAATVIAQGVAFFCAAVYLYRHKEAMQFDFRLRCFAIDREQLGALCRLGIPSVVQQFLITISITFVNSQVNAFDVTASAVDSVGGKLNMVANIITGAISTAAATMIAQSFGARKMDRVKHSFRACMAICMVWWVILSACYLLFPRQIFGLFTTDEQVLELAPTYLRYAVIWLLALCSMDAPFALVQGVGYASFNLVVGLLDGVVARIGLSMVLGHFMGLTGFWLGSGLAGFVTTIAMGIYYLTGRWEKRETITK